MNEEAGISQFILDALLSSPRVTALVGQRIFEDVAPEDESYPFILFSQSSPGQTLGQIGTCERVAVQPLYLVKAVSRSASFDEADRIKAALDAALTGAHGTVQFEGEVVKVKAVHQVAPHRRTEPEDGTLYRHAGGFYRLMAHSRGEG